MIYVHQGGLTLGPSVLGRNSTFANKVFPPKGKSLLDSIAFFGIMIFVFLLGVKIDPAIISRSGKRSFVIGVLGFIVPYTFAGLVAYILNQFLLLDQSISRMLPIVVAITSMTAFPVISCFLSELQILNSEIGRLASSSSLVCDLFYWSVMAIKFASKLTLNKSIGVSLGFFSSAVLLFLFIVFVVHPAALWAIRHTPEGEPVKEIYIIGVLITLMICGFLGQVIGLHAFFVSFLLGLAIPDGPPLGAALVDKLDCIVSVTLSPILFLISGLRTDVYGITEPKQVVVIYLVILFAILGKIVAALLPLLFCRMPFRDALSLGLVMNCKGFIELAVLLDWKLQDVSLFSSF